MLERGRWRCHSGCADQELRLVLGGRQALGALDRPWVVTNYGIYKNSIDQVDMASIVSIT
jgi:hypothetical protein